MPQDVAQESAFLMGMRRFSLTDAVPLLFCLLFSTVLIGIVFFNGRYGIRGLYILPVMLLYMLAMIWVAYALKRYSSFFERNFNAIICGSVLFMLIVNIAMGFILRFNPIFDLGAIYTGAIQWASTGAFMDSIDPTCDPNYFYYFPNNLGGMTLLYVAFKAASFIGLTDYFIVAMTLNALLTALTVTASVLTVKALLGFRGGLMLMTLFLISPPWYIMAPVFYTDSLSALFPVLAFFLYVKYDRSDNARLRGLLGILTGLCIAVGMLIKFTVLIALIAIIIYELLSKGLRRALTLASLSVPVILLVSLAFRGYFYANHIDRDTARRLNTPYTHWVMMSLEGQGTYNPHDYEFTRSFDDPKERSAAIMDEISRRVKEMGPVGLSRLLFSKSTAAFGDGTLAQSDFLDDNPESRTLLHEYILYDGINHELYKYLCTGVFFAILSFMLLGGYAALATGHDEGILPSMRICALGILCFFAMWEVSGRYITNYAPVLMLLSVSGIIRCSDRIFAHTIKS